MLQWKATSGHVFYLNNLLAFAAVTTFGFWICWMMAKKKYDKVIHALVCGAITGVCIAVFTATGLWWWLAPIAAMVIGFGKEFADLINKKKRLFDWMDIVADLYGSGAVTLFYLFGKVLYDSSM